MEPYSSTGIDTIIFVWFRLGSQTQLTLHDHTRTDALKIALDMGFKPFCWYKPNTWRNRIIVYA